MIGKLIGIVDMVEEDHLILNVNGVGYLVFCSNSTLAGISTDSELTLLIEMIVKEDQLSLYGFKDNAEKKWFKLLQTIQGVGARMALSILSFLKPDQLVAAILSKDYNSFKQVSGIGPKLAARIVNELQNKEDLSLLSYTPQAISKAGKQTACGMPSDVLTDALSALSNLGFNRSDAYKVLSEIIAGEHVISLEQLIKQGLAKLSKR